MWFKIKDQFGLFFTIATALFVGYTLGFTIDKNKVDPALIVSCCALAFTFHQFNASRQHQRLSVKPLIMFTYPIEERPTIDGKFTIRIVIVNGGLGPANISDLKWLKDNNELMGNKLIDYIVNSSGLEPLYQSRQVMYELRLAPLTDGFYIKENSNFELIYIAFHAEDQSVTYQTLSTIFENLKRLLVHDLDITCSFTSIYGDDKKYIETQKRNLKEIKNLRLE